MTDDILHIVDNILSHKKNVEDIPLPADQLKTINEAVDIFLELLLFSDYDINFIVPLTLDEERKQNHFHDLLYFRQVQNWAIKKNFLLTVNKFTSNEYINKYTNIMNHNILNYLKNPNMMEKESKPLTLENKKIISSEKEISFDDGDDDQLLKTPIEPISTKMAEKSILTIIPKVELTKSKVVEIEFDFED